MTTRIGRLGAVVLLGILARATGADATPNFIIMLADNLGYGERFIPRLIDVLKTVNGLKT